MRTDRALARLHGLTVPMGTMQADAMPFDMATLDKLRTAVDDATVSAPGAETRYQALDLAAEETFHALLDDLSSMIIRVSGGYVVWSDLEALDAVSDGLVAADSEASSMSELVLESGPSAAPTLARLGQAASLYVADRDHYRDAGVPAVREAWDQIETASSVQVFEHAVEDDRHGCD